MRIQSPISGAMAGSAGNLIFQHYHGRTYGRSKPVLFHYGPTKPQFIAQQKYYGVRRIWSPIYQRLKPYIKAAEQKQANPYNSLSKGVYDVLGTFKKTYGQQYVKKFGFDKYNRLSIQIVNWELALKDNDFYVSLYEFGYSSTVDFVPDYAHALVFCHDLQHMQYDVVKYSPKLLRFAFSNAMQYLPGHSVDIYIALSNDEFFSNFMF